MNSEEKVLTKVSSIEYANQGSFETRSTSRTQFYNDECRINSREDFIIPTLDNIKEMDLDYAESNNEQNKKESMHTIDIKTYDPTNVLLLKCVPFDFNELDIINLLEKYGIILDVYLIKHKGYAYIQFQDLNSAINCYKDLSINKPLINKNTLHIFYTGKTSINKANNIISPPSRHLLLVFEKYYILINNEYIQQLFASFGICNKIFLFQAKYLQAFVEMQDIGQAIKAKECLENSIIPSVQLRIVYIEQKDFFLNQQSYASTPYIAPNITKKDMQMYSMPEINSPFSNMSSFSPLHGLLASPIMNYKMPNWQQQTFDSLPQMGTFLPGNSPLDTQQPQQQHHGNTGFGLGFAGSMNSLDIAEQFDQSLNLNQKGSNINTKAIKECNIVLVKNLPRNIKPINLFRLFGMYGNVQKIKIFFKNPENALIEFSDHSQALLAKMHLNNCPLLGNNILVTISRQGIVINTNNLKKGEENDLEADYTDSKDHRYKILGSKNYKNIAAPSKVLHLSNLSPERTENYYKELFKNYGVIVKMHLLKVDARMILMEMKSINDAVSILINFHNYNVDGKFLKVSFSKYQKIKD